MKHSRRQMLALFGPVAGFAVLSACAPSRASIATPAVVPTASTGKVGTPSSATAPVTAVLPNSDLAVGRNRFLLALLDGNNQPITNAQVHLRFYSLKGEQPVLRAEADALYRGEGLVNRGVYVSTVSFSEAGAWGVEVIARRDQDELPTTRWSFEVQPESRTPALGTPARPSRNPTTNEIDDPAKLCTAVPACDMHDLVIADVVGKGRPLVLYFGTPGFCTSQVCGPGLDVVQQLKERFGKDADFIHIEIYKDPATRTVAETVTEWRLPSEPWLFLIDRQGTIADKFEGGITLPEIEPAVAKLIG